MVCYIYDGSFEGLLTCIYEAYYKKDELEDISTEKNFVPNFFTTPKNIDTDNSKCMKVYNGIVEKISPGFLKKIFYIYLSEVKECEFTIYNYVRLGFKLGKDVDLHLQNKWVLSAHKLADKVMEEEHRMLGFLRFTVIDKEKNIYYGAIEPDHNIVQLITVHFVKRFAKENFIIHDLKREIAAIYNGEEWNIIKLYKEEARSVFKSSGSEFYEDLWKEYFKSASIDSRKNSRLQKRSMPKRYWKHLTELYTK